MTERWRIAANAEAEQFLNAIATELQTMFNISPAEARGRIEKGWQHLPDSSLGGPDELIYHETPDFWACHFYWGGNSKWWVSDADRDRQHLPPLLPTPFP